MLGDHKRILEELEEKLKKSETVKEKLEKSKEEAIQVLNDKVKTLQETHAEETQALKTDKAKMVSEQEMLQGKCIFILYRQLLKTDIVHLLDILDRKLILMYLFFRKIASFGGFLFFKSK